MARTLYKRFAGEFLSRDASVWRAEIWQEAAAPWASVGGLVFPAESPLTVEWNETACEDPLCPSIATLTVEAQEDREFLGLYAVEPESVRLDVYRDGALFWRGTLSPETYEEPYERARFYDVTLTFYDFGNLERLKWRVEEAPAALCDLSWYIFHALERAGLCTDDVRAGYVDTSLVSGRLTDGGEFWSGLRLRADNFVDEDGEGANLRDMLEDILRPLGVRMVQKAGRIWLYDLNGLYRDGKTALAEWAGDSQTLGVERTYNSVRISFSPYASGALLETDSLELPATWYDASDVNLLKPASENAVYGRQAFSFLRDYNPDRVRMTWTQLHNDGIHRADFTAHVIRGERRESCGQVILGPSANAGGGKPCFVHIEPNLGNATRCDCVAAALWEGGIEGPGEQGYPYPLVTRISAGSDFNAGSALKGIRAAASGPLYPVFSVAPRYLPPLPATRGLWIRIKAEMLLDARYNPFTEVGEDNEAGNTATMKDDPKLTQMVYVPFRLRLTDTAGRTVAHYSNAAVLSRAQVSGDIVSDDIAGGWATGDAPANGTDAWLSYYKLDDGKRRSAVSQGFAANRRPLAPAAAKGPNYPADYPDGAVTVSPAAEASAEGEFVPYPTAADGMPADGGYIVLEVLAGVRVTSMDRQDMLLAYMKAGVEADSLWKASGYYRLFSGISVSDAARARQNIVRWQLFKCPQIDILSQSGQLAEVETDDVEYNGVVNAAAADELKLDTTCGTLPAPCQTARGCYIMADGAQLKEITRGGLTGQPEKLLIGTLISQYGGRRQTLAGEAIIPAQEPHTLTDAADNDAARKHYIKEEVLDAIAGTSEIVMAELRPDEVAEYKELPND